jgi:hypothetical protein
MEFGESTKRDDKQAILTGPSKNRPVCDYEQLLNGVTGSNVNRLS